MKCKKPAMALTTVSFIIAAVVAYTLPFRWLAEQSLPLVAKQRPETTVDGMYFLFLFTLFPVLWSGISLLLCSARVFVFDVCPACSALNSKTQSNNSEHSVRQHSPGHYVSSPGAIEYGVRCKKCGYFESTSGKQGKDSFRQGGDHYNGR